MKILLEKLSKNEGGLRTSTVEGICDYLPRVGKRFVMSAPPLEGGDVRIVSTSLVVDIDCEKNDPDIYFLTENSQYRLTLQ